MTHAELVERAALWLRTRQQCSVVVTELVSGMSVKAYTYQTKCTATLGVALEDG